MTIAIRPEPLGDYRLVATSREQLAEAHARMTEWTSKKLEHVDVDLDVETTNLEIAVDNGWVTAPFERRIASLKRQRVFYDKIRQAIDLGYAIVPNFQMNVFAIRTSAKGPRGAAVRNTSHWRHSDFVQDARILPAGEGEYKNPLPVIHSERDDQRKPDGSVERATIEWPEEFRDIAFPFALARPELMQSVSEAAARKLFDEIGVATDTWQRSRASGRQSRGDPILLGRLLNPKRDRVSVTFFLGWYFDPSRI